MPRNSHEKVTNLGSEMLKASLEKDDDDEASGRLSKVSFAFAVLGQQPEDGDGLRGEGFEDRGPSGIRLQGSQPPIRTGPGTWPPGQRADRGFCLYHGVSLCRLSSLRLRAEIQADGEEMRGERRPSVWYRRLS